MGAIEDVRQVIQDLVAPELKSLQEKINRLDDGSRMRDEALSAKIYSNFERVIGMEAALSAKIDSKFDLLWAKLETNHQAMIFAMNIDKRVEAIERKVAEPVHAS